jgi:hypothetical protein
MLDAANRSRESRFTSVIIRAADRQTFFYAGGESQTLGDTADRVRAAKTGLCDWCTNRRGDQRSRDARVL